MWRSHNKGIMAVPCIVQRIINDDGQVAVHTMKQNALSTYRMLNELGINPMVALDSHPSWRLKGQAASGKSIVFNDIAENYPCSCRADVLHLHW
jgi:hypothetical protein